jgi:hypothetical protein
MPKKPELAEILPENIQAQATYAKQTFANTPNISLAPVEKNQEFDAGQFDTAYKASAAAHAEHLNFAGQIANLREPLLQLKQSFNQTATQLNEIRHLDTRVNVVRNQQVFKMDIPGDMKAYANNLDQVTYLQILLTFLAEKRLGKLREYIIRGGQIDHPALWLNQQLYIETKMPYAYTLDREITAEQKKECTDTVAKIEQKQPGLCAQAFRHCFGEELYTALTHIADVNKMHIYLVFVLLIDKIIGLHEELSAPAPSVNLWQSVLGKK